MPEQVTTDVVARNRFSRVFVKFGKQATSSFRISERAASRAIRSFRAFRGSILSGVAGLISLKAAIAAAGVGFLTKQLISLAQAQEDAVKGLNAALATTGQFSIETSESIQRLASSLQLQTTFGDEAILNMQSLLVTYGVTTDKLEEASQATLDFAVATGRDLKTAALTVGKAAAGFTGELSRYGIIIDKNIPKTEKFRAVLDKMNEQFRGRAQAEVRTFSGRMTQLRNATGDLSEAFGESIINSVALREAISDLTLGVLALAGGAREADEGSGKFGDAIAVIIPTAETLIGIFDVLERTIAALALVFFGIGEAIIGLVFIIGAILRGITGLDIGVQDLSDSFDFTTGKLKENFKVLTEGSDTVNEAEEALKALRAEMKKTGEETARTTQAFKSIKEFGFDLKGIFGGLQLRLDGVTEELIGAQGAAEGFTLSFLKQRNEVNQTLSSLSFFEQGVKDRIIKATLEASEKVPQQFAKMRELVTAELDRLKEAAEIRSQETLQTLTSFSAGFQAITIQDTTSFLNQLTKRFNKEKEILGETEAEENRVQRAKAFAFAAGASTILKLAETFGGESVAIRKASAVAEAIINTSVAVTRALAEGGPFSGPLLAGIIAAQGAAQIATILATQPGARGGISIPGGGGAEGGAPGGPPVAEAAPAAPSREVTINITGFVGDEALLADELLRIQREAVGDGLESGLVIRR